MTGEYEAWVGREEKRSELVLASTVQAMAAALDMEGAPEVGAHLPPGWQWLFFNPVVRQSALGADGHPARGGLLPPAPLPRRMWAGSRIEYRSDIPIGAEATKRSKILRVEEKTGKRGSLCFVTVEHTIECEGAPCIFEEQDIVYREPPPPGANAGPPERYQAEAQWSETFNPTTTLLFRYSALTFNGHGIHYDQAYARDEEGYPDLVVHGPLIATLLQMFAAAHGGGRCIARFDFRGVAPLYVGRAFQLEGRVAEAETLSVWARGPDGELAMSATVAFK